MGNSSTMLLNPSPERKQYRVVGIAMFVIATALLAVRTVSYLIGSAVFSGEVEDEILVNILFELGFTVAVQIGILLVAVFLIYKYALKKTAREVLEFSNFRKTKWFNYALTVPIGFLALFVTLGVSTIWRIIIIGFGYTPAVPADTYPENFNPGLFFLEMFLIAVLPGFCEEFAIRGGLLTTMSKSFRGRFFYIVMAVAFGLFHQNITQVFYTALFGGAMAFLAVKTKSIYPCMIVHFLNNGISVYLAYAGQYGWFAGGLFDLIWENLFVYLFLVFPMLTVALIGLLAAVSRLNPSKKDNGALPTVQAPPKSAYGGHPQSGYGSQGSLPPAVQASAAAEPGEKHFRPVLADNAFYIGAIVTAALFTVFSFVWGFFY